MQVAGGPMLRPGRTHHSQMRVSCAWADSSQCKSRSFVCAPKRHGVCRACCCPSSCCCCSPLPLVLAPPGAAAAAGAGPAVRRARRRGGGGRAHAQAAAGAAAAAGGATLRDAAQPSAGGASRQPSRCCKSGTIAVCCDSWELLARPDADWPRSGVRSRLQSRNAALARLERA